MNTIQPYPTVPLSQHPWNTLHQNAEMAMLIAFVGSIFPMSFLFLWMWGMWMGFAASVGSMLFLYIMLVAPYVPWRWVHIWFSAPWPSDFLQLREWRANLIIWVSSISPKKAHRWAAFLGSIQNQSHRTFTFLSKLRDWHNTTEEQWALLWQTACSNNNSFAGHYLLNGVIQHLGAGAGASILIEQRNPYGQMQCLKQFNSFRMDALDHMTQHMNDMQLMDFWAQTDFLERLWSSDHFVSDTLMTHEEITDEQTLARIGARMAQHQQLHPLLQQVMRREQQRWDMLESIHLRHSSMVSARQEQLRDIRFHAIAHIQAVMLQQSLGDACHDMAGRGRRKM